MSPVEVITSVQRRRHWTAEQKRALVEEAGQPGMSISLVARKYEVHPNQLFRWRKLMQDGALVAAGSEDQVNQEGLEGMLIAHMNQGVEILSSRVRTLADMASLLPRRKEATYHSGDSHPSDNREVPSE